MPGQIRYLLLSARNGLSLYQANKNHQLIRLGKDLYKDKKSLRGYEIAGARRLSGLEGILLRRIKKPGKQAGLMI
jgi:hypothetical protein